MHAMLRSSHRFLDRPLSLAARGVDSAGDRGARGRGLSPVVAHTTRRAAVPGGPVARDVQPQDRGRERRPGPRRDQHAQPLHRDETDRAERFRRDDLDAVRHRHLRSALVAAVWRSAGSVTWSTSGCCSSISEPSRWRRSPTGCGVTAITCAPTLRCGWRRSRRS